METKFNKLVNTFFNPSFPLSEKTLNKLVAKLRKADFKNRYMKDFSYKIIDDLMQGGYTDYNDKEIGICYTANRLLNAKNSPAVLNAYKVNFLTTYYHEACHEQQYEEYLHNELNNNPDEYAKLLGFDFKYLSSCYHEFNSLNEIDARYNSVKRIVADIKSGKIEDNKNIYPFILCEILNMLNGINACDINAEFQQKPFNAYRVLKRYDDMYNSLNEYNVEAKLTDKFKQNFTLQFEEKMKNFFENEYKFVVTKVIENYQPTKAGFVYLTANWKNRIASLIDNPTRRDLWVLTTDSVNQVKNQALDFTYRKEDLDEFLLKHYNRCDKVGYETFILDTRSHKLFERFLLRKYTEEKNSENTLL